MWQRFTEGTRNAIVRAQKVANDRSENLVKPEHLMIGLLAESDTVAYRLLQEAGIVVGDLVRHLEDILTPGPGRDGSVLRLDTSAKKAIDRAWNEAQRQRRNYIGTEHLILGIIATDSGATGITLRHFGLDLARGRYLADTVEHFSPAYLEVPLNVHSDSVVAARQREPTLQADQADLRWKATLPGIITGVVAVLFIVLLRGCG